MVGVWIRADASPEQGSGHVARCLALATALAGQGREVTFVSRGLAGSLRRRLAAVATVVEPCGDAPAAEAAWLAAQAQGAEVVVLDGYDFDETYRRVLRRAGLRLAVVDDLNRPPVATADLIINAAPTAFAAGYDRSAAGARLLLGPDYALVDPAVAARRKGGVMPAGERDRVLVCFGGADPARFTLPTVEALVTRDVHRRLPLLVVTGGANPQYGAVAEDCARLGVEHRHDRPGLVEEMAVSRLALGAAGGSVYELAAMGVPSVLCPVAANQQPLAGYLAAEQDWCRVRHDPEAMAEAAAELVADPQACSRMGEAAAAWIDGRGAERLARVLVEETAA